MIYSIKGPGVDEDPKGIFFIDKLSGKVYLNAMLDREKNDRFQVRAACLGQWGGWSQSGCRGPPSKVARRWGGGGISGEAEAVDLPPPYPPAPQGG